MDQQPKVLPKPVDWDELYPGRFIKAVDLKGKPVTLKITAIDMEELEGNKGIQRKGTVSFAGTEKKLALNKTNGICLKAMFGKKVQEWVGHRVTLFPTRHNDDDAIRVYGSPEIKADFEITIALPRKRPFDMTMRKTPEVGARRAGKVAPEPELKWQDIAVAEKAIRACESLDALQQLFESIIDEYRAAGRQFPVELEAAHNETHEGIEAQASEGFQS